MAAGLRAVEGEIKGIGQVLKSGLEATPNMEEEKKDKVVLINKAGGSRSPYIRAHASNPVAWQLWGDEAITLAQKENKLIFLSVGFSACHTCHLMDRESFSNDDIAATLNESFIPIIADKEERPDIDRIYMNFISATSGAGGWPLNVFLTPDLKPLFGGAYWPGPGSSSPTLEGSIDFLGILDKLAISWKDQEERCRIESVKSQQSLKDFAGDGTNGDKLGASVDVPEIELLERVNNQFIATFDKHNGGFGTAPKYPTPHKLSFLLRLRQYPQVVLDVVGPDSCKTAEDIALITLRKMARSGTHDQIGHGFSRYSITADWSLPKFEKMLYDNAQLLHVYLDGFLLSRDPEFLGIVYDIGTYLTTSLSHPTGGFYTSESADSFYKRGDSEKREGAFYLWTKREFENILDSKAEPILSAFYNVSSHGNVPTEEDPHDEFIDQNVLQIISNPTALASTFGMKEEEIVKIIKEGKAILRAHREKERVQPNLDDKIIVSWNGLAIGALSRAGAVIKGFDPEKSEIFVSAASRAAKFIKENLYEESTKTLYRVWHDGHDGIRAFAEDYAFLIEGLIDLYEATFDEAWLKWADELQKSQIDLFYDESGNGAFFSTTPSAPHIILRLKVGMDENEPSTNGISASNLYRLSNVLNDEFYLKKAKETVAGFESEILEYPWLFCSFMPSIIAGHMGLKSTVVCGEGIADNKIKAFEKQPRGSLGSFAKVGPSNIWLRERNSLLREFGLDGKPRVLICEGGVCRDEGLEVIPGPRSKDPLEMEGIAAALPTAPVAPAAGAEDEVKFEVKSQSTPEIETAKTEAKPDTAIEPIQGATIPSEESQKPL